MESTRGKIITGIQIMQLHPKTSIMLYFQPHWSNTNTWFSILNPVWAFETLQNIFQTWQVMSLRCYVHLSHINVREPLNYISECISRRCIRGSKHNNPFWCGRYSVAMRDFCIFWEDISCSTAVIFRVYLLVSVLRTNLSASLIISYQY